MVVGEYRIVGGIVDDNGLSMLANFIADRRLDLQLAAGLQAEATLSRTLQAIQRSSVTCATAANPMPVVLQTTSRMVGTAAICETA